MNTVVKRPLIGVGVVVEKNGKVLLGKRKGSHAPGTWCFPGGHLEFGESVEACAARELEEETGLKALYVKLGPWAEDRMDIEKHYITLFVFVEAEGEPKLLEPDKCEGWEWFTWEALPEPLFVPVKSLIEKKVLVQKALLGNSFFNTEIPEKPEITEKF